MGIGEEALSAFLTPEGWSLNPAALAHFGKRADTSSARRALLDVDLSRVGLGCLPSWAREDDGTSGGELVGPMVLQLVRASDISRPLRRPAASTVSAAARADSSGGAPRMLRLELTDGDAVVVGVEHAPSSPSPPTPPLPPGRNSPSPRTPASSAAAASSSSAATNFDPSAVASPSSRRRGNDDARSRHPAPGQRRRR